MIEIEIANEQSLLPIDQKRLCAAARRALEDHGYGCGQVSLAIVDDATIHKLNREYLAHDYPTDVLSFALQSTGEPLLGQIVASAETARTAAGRYGWSVEDELLLYVVHGALHLAGLDDSTPDAAAQMRAAEAKILAILGVSRKDADGGMYADDDLVDSEPGDARGGDASGEPHGERVW